MKTSLIDPKSNLTWKFDAIHGDIDIRDATDSSKTETITKLLKSPALERLRRIKQLGFASHSYTSADHSRYAHSLGTMHMMRMLFNRLFIVQGLKPEILSDLTDCFPDVFDNQNDKDKKIFLFSICWLLLFFRMRENYHLVPPQNISTNPVKRLEMM